MTKVALYFLFAPLALILLLFHQQFEAMFVGTIFFAIAIRSDWMASRLFGGAAEEKPPADESVEIRVHRLVSRAPVTPPPSPAPAASLPAPGAETAEPPRRVPERRTGAGPRRLPASPNFRGPAHEVLGVSEDSRTRTIVSAFRHWIKRFHPDQAQDLPAELANARVQRLTEAKELLLERRRSRKAA